MTPTVIATIILIATVIMFFSPKIPTTATALVGTIAMAAFGILPAKSVFNYYSSTTCVLIIGGGMMETGFAGWLGNKLVGMTGKGEKNLRLAAVLSGWFMSSVASGSASMMILYPILCSIYIASQVSMSRIMFPMFAGIGFGSLMTVAGSGMCGATSAILQEAGFRGWSFFEPAWIGFPMALASTLVIYFFGDKLLPETMVLPDAAEAEKAKNIPTKFTGRMTVSAVILVLTIIGMVIK